MPKSKKDKKISLTRTAKHGMDWKKKMVEDVREAASKYTRIYSFEVVGMRTAGLRELRHKWRGSRIILGKNKIMSIALGKDEQSEIKENLSQLSSRLKGSCGLLFTDESDEKVVNFFDNFVEWDYARAGNKATETIVLEEGKLTQFPHSIEPHLRSLGLPTSLQRGIVTLVKEFPVCKKGQILNAEQAKILKLLEKPMAEFRIVLDSMWSLPDEFKIFPRKEEEEDDEVENEEIVDDDDVVLEAMDDDGDDDYEDVDDD